MMITTEQTIISVTYFISVYSGFFTVVVGLIGNIINILVFTQLKLFRRNQSAFYLTVVSIADCGQLIFVTATRVTTTTFGFDPTRTSIIWCKLRAYIVQFGVIMSIWTVCFATIDQFLSTSYHNLLRQMSTFNLAQGLISGLAIFSTIYSIIFLIFNEIRVNSGCATFNFIFNYYYSFVHLCILVGILPIVISSFFSLLAYRNVRRIVRRQIPVVRRRLDRQLTAMILVRVALFVITTLPFVSYRIYQINNPVNQNDTYAVAVDQLIKSVVTVIVNATYAGGFYLFLISSARFHRQVKYLFFKKIWPKCLTMIRNRNQVAPERQLQVLESHESNVDTN